MKKFFDRVGLWFTRFVNRMTLRNKYRKLRSLSKQEQRALTRSFNAVLGTIPQYPDSDIAFEIVKVQSRRKDSEILFAPISNEFYITNGEQYIIVTAKSVSIINGVYHYDVKMPQDAIYHLDKYLKRIVQRRRVKIKNYMQSKIDRSLHDILRHVLELEK